MLRIFEEQVMPLIAGRAKAMIVTSSRVAGLRYFNIIKEKLKARGAKYKVLYAFSDFTHPETNAEIHEHAVNELQPGELIKDRFEGEDYRLMVVVAALEFARRRIKPGGLQITTPAEVLPLIRHFADRKQEHFLCITINGANEVLNVRVVSIGLLDRAPVHPREVFAEAVTDRASGGILAHNHPEGGLDPSPADLEITRQIKLAGEHLGIALLDHIIFNPHAYFSFLEAGRL